MSSGKEKSQKRTNGHSGEPDWYTLDLEFLGAHAGNDAGPNNWEVRQRAQRWKRVRNGTLEGGDRGKRDAFIKGINRTRRRVQAGEPPITLGDVEARMRGNIVHGTDGVDQQTSTVTPAEFGSKRIRTDFRKPSHSQRA